MGAASELARRFGDEAEAVCRAYLPNGERSAATGSWATFQAIAAAVYSSSFSAMQPANGWIL